MPKPHNEAKLGIPMTLHEFPDHICCGISVVPFQCMDGSGPSLTQALEEEHRAELERDDSRF